MALQVFHIHSHLCRNLVLIWSAVVYGSVGARGPTWWDSFIHHSSFSWFFYMFFAEKDFLSAFWITNDCCRYVINKMFMLSVMHTISLITVIFYYIMFLQILTLQQTTHPVWCKCRLWRGHSFFPWNPKQLLAMVSVVLLKNVQLPSSSLLSSWSSQCWWRSSSLELSWPRWLMCIKPPELRIVA